MDMFNVLEWNEAKLGLQQVENFFGSILLNRLVSKYSTVLYYTILYYTNTSTVIRYRIFIPWRSYRL